MPTINDVLSKIVGAKVFSTADVHSGFWNLKLDDESSRLTVFETPFGSYSGYACHLESAQHPRYFKQKCMKLYLDFVASLASPTTY